MLLEIQQIGVSGKIATVFFDNGSSATMATHNFAQKAGLVGTRMTYYLGVVGHSYTQKNTLMYEMKMVDRQGIEHVIHALGIDTISDESEDMDLSKVKHLFPYAPKEAFE